NWAFLLDAAKKCSQQHPSLRVVLLGDCPDTKNLEMYAEKLGIANRVEFLGDIPFVKVPAYLQAADFFGFASTSETQGLVTLEALAASLPVVAVDAPGTRDIMENGGQGYLVKEDADAFAQAVDDLLSQPERQAQFKQAAIQRAEQFEIHKMAAKLLDVYTQAKEDKQAKRFVQVRADKGKPSILKKRS
ncbi:MAG: glycosyltransferase, partial [Anaerolineales bacterium]